MTVRLGELPFEGFNPERIVGTRVSVDEYGGHGGHVTRAWVEDGWLHGEITVPDTLARAMFADASEHVSIGARRPEEPIELPDPFSPKGALFTVDKYGGVHTIKRVYRGGFRSRYHVQWARGIGRSIKHMWSDYLVSLQGHFERMEEEDRQRACPHPVNMRTVHEGALPWTRCKACGKYDV